MTNWQGMKILSKIFCAWLWVCFSRCVAATPALLSFTTLRQVWRCQTEATETHCFEQLEKKRSKWRNTKSIFVHYSVLWFFGAVCEAKEKNIWFKMETLAPTAGVESVGIGCTRSTNRNRSSILLFGRELASVKSGLADSHSFIWHHWFFVFVPTIYITPTLLYYLIC